jgi:hypothetical protein
MVPSLALTALLAAALGATPAPAPPPPAAAEVAAPEQDPEAPPAGSAAEQALWRRAHDTNDRVTTDRAATTRLHLRAKAAVERLQAMTAAGALAPERAKALEREVVEAWKGNISMLKRQWPVDPTRACRYDQLDFESAMYVSEAAGRAHQVADASRALEACLARADAALAKLAASTKQLQHEVAEAEQVTAAFSDAAPTAPAASPSAVPGK